MGSDKRVSNSALKKETRRILVDIGRKNQSYDQVIRDLIISKNKLDSLESRFAVPDSSEPTTTNH